MPSFASVPNLTKVIYFACTCEEASICQEVQHLIIDKTDTLFRDILRLKEIESFNRYLQLLRMLQALEASSE